MAMNPTLSVVVEVKIVESVMSFAISKDWKGSHFLK